MQNPLCALTNKLRPHDTSAPVYRLENWEFVDGGRLTGEVYGNPRFKDGEVILTTEVMSYTDRDPYLAFTRNSVYRLGKRA